MTLIFFIKHYIFPLWRSVAGSLLLIIVQTVSIVPVALLTQKLFDHVLIERNAQALYITLAIILTLLIINSLAAIANRYLALHVVKTALGKVRRDVLNRVLNTSILEHSRRNSDSVHSNVVHDTERIDRMISALLTQCIPSALVVAGLFCVLVYLSPLLAVMTGLMVPMLLLVGKSIGKRAEAWTRTFHVDFARFSEGVFFVLGFAELIKHSASEAYELKRQGSIIEALRNSSHRMAWLTTAYVIMQSNVTLVSGILVLLVGGTQVIAGALSIGSLISFYIALSFLTTHLRSITATIAVMIEGRHSLSALAPFLEIHPIAPVSVPFGGFQREIMFAGVQFSHGPHFTLSDISFAVKKGDMVGLYGGSGAGKSTLIHLALGLYVPQQGLVQIDGVDLATLDGAGYRARCGVLSQYAFVFDGTIRENLLYGLENVSDELLKEAARNSEAHDFISAFERGYDTQVGMRGMRLSGGQRQRIAITRALLRNPDLLILDEPDNNLDIETMVRILTNIRAKGITALVITHQPELQKHFAISYELVSGQSGMSLRLKHI